MTKTLRELIAEGHNIDERGGPRWNWTGCNVCHDGVGCDFLGPYGRDGLPMSAEELRSYYVVWAA